MSPEAASYIIGARQQAAETPVNSGGLYGFISNKLETSRRAAEARALRVRREMAQGRSLRKLALERLTHLTGINTDFPRTSGAIQTEEFGSVVVNVSSLEPETHDVLIYFDSRHMLRDGRKTFSVMPSGNTIASFQDADLRIRPRSTKVTSSEKIKLANALAASETLEKVA